MKILLTSTSFQDTPGKHQDLLKKQGWDVDTLRGPLKEKELLAVVSKYDGLICGDDEITEKVIAEGKSGRLKAISKYGIGLDKIDLNAAKKYEIPVTNTPGVNHIAVAEHTLALIFTYYKNIFDAFSITKKGEWKRPIGNEVFGKSILILGLGRIGRELALRAKSLGLLVYAMDVVCDEDFINKNSINFTDSISNVIDKIDILSINCPLTDETRGMVNSQTLAECKSDLIIVNTARAAVINQDDLLNLLDSNKIAAYLTDVLLEEPLVKDNPLLMRNNVFITPHIGSRTFESVERQGIMAVENMIKLLI
ncbi:MAG: NAD(P)-dependent oxidoreductase [Stygiobacter sp.]